ncbi:MAG TPA: nucleotidyltransferase family protein, partial [Thermoanaerobaculia bacterium]|nr:nucleotidyltransferase family protein [Thermoanaerobaculia bacterium]
MNVAAIVLAAGASTRMGRAKQLLPFRGSTLVRAVAEAALASTASRVLVVLGANAERVAAALEGLRVETVPHDGWRHGLGSSLAAGVRAARAFRPDAVLLVLGDQPLVTAASLDRLIAAHRGGAPLAAAERDGVVGAPALFSSAYFDTLAALDTDDGARAVLLSHAAELAAVPMPEAAFDVDTEADR